MQARVHKARGGGTTFHGLRRDEQGRPLNKRSRPTPGELEAISRMREQLGGFGLGAVRGAWADRTGRGVVLAALTEWLSIIGEIYAGNPTEVGIDWFLHDYCSGYSEPSQSAELRRQLQSALMRPVDVNMKFVLDSVEEGFVDCWRRGAPGAR